MQGIIASLLALMMTGMVFSQQPQSSILSSTENQNPGLLKRYLLVVNQMEKQILKTEGFRYAHIEEQDRQTFDRIEFHATVAKSDQRDLEPYNIQPVPPVDGDEILVFEMDDYYLRLLEQKGLRYRLPPSDIGRFKAVNIKYLGPNQQASSSLPLTQPGGQPLSPRNSTSPFSSNTNVSQLNQQMAGRSADRNDTPFYGPRLPDSWEPTSTAQPTTDSATFRPQFGSIATRRESSNSLQGRRDHLAVDSQGDRMIPVLPAPGQNANTSGDYQNRSTINNRVASNTPFENGAFGAENPQLTTRGIDQAAVPSISTGYDPVREELRLRNVQNRSLDQLNQTLTDENEVLRRQLQKQRLANQHEQLAFRNDPTVPAYDPEFDYQSLQRRQSHSNQIVVQPPTNTSQTMPERLDVTPRPGNQLLPTMEIGGPTGTTEKTGSAAKAAADPEILADSERYRQQNAALWFIMLCSVGLNFYLAWIARGFYVRYEELADDIRETFTSSV